MPGRVHERAEALSWEERSDDVRFPLPAQNKLFYSLFFPAYGDPACPALAVVRGIILNSMSDYWNYTGGMMGWGGYASNRPGLAGMFLFGWLLLIAWSLFWKAWALWISAREGKKIWFGVLLVINTMGILEILYIFIFSKMKPSTPVATPPSNTAGTTQP